MKHRIPHIFTLLIISLLCFSGSLSAQDDQDFYIYGSVKDHFSRKKIAGVTVKVLQDGKAFDSQTSASSGKYEFFLPLDHHYEFIFSNNGFESKKVEIDTRNIPEEDRRGGFSLNMDMSIFESIEGVDFSVLDQPIGKGSYVPDRGSIEFDFAYTNRIQAEIDKLLRELENKKKEEEKEEDKEAQAAIKLQEQFDKLMKEGKDNMTKKAYEGAVTKYQGAVDLIPDNADAKAKLAEAKKLFDEQNAAAAAEKKYTDLIDKADASFKARNWQESVNDYNAALEIKKGEKYPIDQISAAEKELEKEKEQAEALAEVAQLIKEGDGYIGKEEFQNGIDKFKAALQVISDNKEAQDKLADAQKRLSDWEANKEKREQFDALVKEADGHFSGDDFSNAIDKYQAALKVIPDDDYAVKRLKESEDMLAKQKAAADEAEEMARKQAEYDKFMTAGDAGMEASNYDTAIGSYQNALGVFPDDKPAQKKLEDAQKAKADALASLAADEQYASLIKEADKLFEKKEYEGSIDQYTAALELKKEDYPKGQIEKARKIIEELKAKEEEEQKAREAEMEAADLAKEQQRRFDEFVTAGDGGMSSSDFELAIDKYESALEIFPTDAKALDKLKKAQDARAKELADMEEAERLKADQAVKDAAMAGEREKQQRFDELMTQGDKAFKANTFQPAIDSYTQALTVIPEDKGAQSKLDRAIEALKKEQDRLADEEQRMKDQEAKDAELAAQREKDDAANSEKEKRERLNEEYDNFIRMADGFFADKDYRVAQVNYEEALSLKPDETYPATRLERIKKLMEQQGEEERLRQERLAREREEAESRDFARGNDLDQSDEDRIDAEMAAKRRKEQQDKWDAMNADKEKWSESLAGLSDNEGSRIEENIDEIERVKRAKAEREERARKELEDRTRNMEGYKEGLQSQDRSYGEEHNDRIEANSSAVNKLEEEMAGLQSYYDTDTYKEKHVEAVSDYEKSRENLAKRGQRTTGQSQEDALDQKASIQETSSGFIKDADERLKEKQEDIQETKERIQSESSDNSRERLIKTSEELEREKERQDDFQRALTEASKENREIEKEKVMSVETYAGGKSPIDYKQSELAAKYPAGVTEETFEEGTKMVIRRIVVVGNKATEYRKVVSRSGTYYFKNDQSITEHLWKIESDKVTE